MKYKNIVVAVLVGAGSFAYGNPGDQTNLGNFISPLIDPVFTKVSAFVQDASRGASAELNGGFGDLESIDALPAEGILPDKGSVKSKMDNVKGYFQSMFKLKPIAATEQEKKSVRDQISENLETTAAITVGLMVALYGSYKLVQYFDHKKVKKIALARHLKAQKDRQAVVFE